MLRIHLQQQWYSLSDPAMEEAVIEVPTMRHIVGIELISDRTPDGTTILAFRHLLEKHELGERLSCCMAMRRLFTAMPASRALPSVPR
jgi:IS5 family transposase